MRTRSALAFAALVAAAALTAAARVGPESPAPNAAAVAVTGEAAAPGTRLPAWEPELGGTLATPGTPTPQAFPRADGAADPIYLVYYWRARPGKTAEYSAYIREVAEPIDEAGRQDGAFEWVKTYAQGFQTGAPGADWTHIRIFKLSSYAAWDDFSPKLDAAGSRLFTPEQRAAQRERSAPLRDLVRQEIWREF